jgi:cell division protein FtsA
VANNSVIAALDVGSTKTCCLVAKVTREGVCVLGHGINRSRGVKGGVIVNMSEAEKAIRSAITSAENMAGVTIDDVYVSLSGGHIESQIVYDKISVSENKPIKAGDVSKLIEKSLKRFSNEDHMVIHRLPIAYDIDGDEIVENPIGMKGAELGVSISSVSSTTVSVQTLENVVKRCYLDVSGVVVAPYASGLAVLSPDEKQLGAVLVDFGGGSIGISAFMHGHLIRSTVLPFGGEVVTSDIARGLRASITSAERLKTLHGTAYPSIRDDYEFLSYVMMGDDEGVEDGETTKAKLSNIISSRVSEMFDVVQKYLKKNDMEFLLHSSIVLAGGGSQLQGILELAEGKFKNASVRLAKIHQNENESKRIVGLDDATNNASFLVCIGLLKYAIGDHIKKTDKSGSAQETKMADMENTAKNIIVGKLKKLFLSGF